VWSRQMVDRTRSAWIMCSWLHSAENWTEAIHARDVGTLSSCLDAIHSLAPITTAERDAILCAAGVVPPDVAVLVTAHPELLDAVRAMLEGKRTAKPISVVTSAAVSGSA